MDRSLVERTHLLFGIVVAVRRRSAVYNVVFGRKDGIKGLDRWFDV